MTNISIIDHVGIRVVDKERSLAFYSRLGFTVDPDEDAPDYKAVGLVNAAGARIHLIYNSPRAPDVGNILLDNGTKWPGYTHAAFVVEDLDALLRQFAEWGVTVTEGPMIVGAGRRKLCFIRDPDYNVLEFNELMSDHVAAAPGTAA